MNYKHWLLVCVSCLLVVFVALEIVVLFQFKFVDDEVTRWGMYAGAAVWTALAVGGLYLAVKDQQDRIIFVVLTLLLSAFAGVSVAGISVPMLLKWAQGINVVMGLSIFLLDALFFLLCWGECGKTNPKVQT